MSRTYCVYILANRSRGLYTGMGNNLERRTIEHRQELIAGFTSRYRIFRLVHFEFFNDVRAAIAREKEIKGWRREKKIRLIESHNPTWSDLADHFPAKHKKADPSRGSPTPGDRIRDDNRSQDRTVRASTPPPVIPTRTQSPRETPSTPIRTTPKPKPVIRNRAQSPVHPTPRPSPSSLDPNAGEGSAVSSSTPRRTT